jgi:hypothetical protein
MLTDLEGNQHGRRVYKVSVFGRGGVTPLEARDQSCLYSGCAHRDARTELPRCYACYSSFGDLHAPISL